jgi:SAM-dependent methyltransferase
MDQRAVWDATFAQGDEHRSWYEPRPSTSLNAIEAIAPSRRIPIIDVGGGSSQLAGALLTAGYTDLTVLDISETALSLARRRLGKDADRVNWVRADLLDWQPPRRYEAWHDRAVLHFFVHPANRRTYAETLHAALAPGGHTIIATFAPDGPSQCSGLPVQRNSADEILKLLGSDFTTIDTSVETHTTPSGKDQPFTWVIARRRRADPTAESPLRSTPPAPMQVSGDG